MLQVHTLLLDRGPHLCNATHGLLHLHLGVAAHQLSTALLKMSWLHVVNEFLVCWRQRAEIAAVLSICDEEQVVNISHNSADTTGKQTTTISIKTISEVFG